MSWRLGGGGVLVEEREGIGRIGEQNLLTSHGCGSWTSSVVGRRVSSRSLWARYAARKGRWTLCAGYRPWVRGICIFGISKKPSSVRLSSLELEVERQTNHGH